MTLFHSLLTLAGNLVSTVVAITGIGFLIGFHECGHFLFNKLFKVNVPSFSIGFGPRIISKKIGETDFAISAIPLGGYVEADMASFNTKPYYQKLLILFGGIGLNFLFAYFAFCLLFLIGLPKTELLYPTNATTTIQEVLPDSNALKAGLQAGDTITGIQVLDQSTPIESGAHLLQVLKNMANVDATITVQRDGVLKNIPLTIGSRQFFGQTVGTLGAVLKIEAQPGVSFFVAIKEGVKLTNTYIKTTFKAFVHMFSKRDTSNMGSPIAVISESIKGASKGFKIFLIFLAIISINLAILNLIPLPPLDGSRILLTTIETIMRRPIPDRIQEYIFIGGWLIILGLTLFLSARDIVRLLMPYLASLMHFFGK